jgi:glycosyltransferase involved in cell wall biosynthesis
MGWSLGLPAFVLGVVLAKLFGVSVVWHAHNIRPHGSAMPQFVEDLLYRFFIRAIDGYVHMSPGANERLLEAWPGLAAKRSQLIRHGDYRECYPVIPERKYARARLGIPEEAFVIGSYGVIKKYKNVEQLCRIFSELESDELILRIQGKCGDPQLRGEVEGVVTRCSSISYSTEWLTDAEYALEVAACDLIALPYSRILNSGNAIFALSMNTPVLVTASAPMSDLMSDVGQDWVHLIDGDLSSDRLKQVIDEVRETDVTCEANLDLYSWEEAGASLNTYFTSLNRRP